MLLALGLIHSDVFADDLVSDTLAHAYVLGKVIKPAVPISLFVCKTTFFTFLFFDTLESQLRYIVRIATSDDHKYAIEITDEMASSAQKRGTGIARRTPEYVKMKMDEGKAVIAVNPDNNQWVGFCYIEAWQHEKYVANSGLIVSPNYRGLGVAKKIKTRIFELSRQKYPEAKIFGLTTGLAVMRINSDLGYEPVPYSELTQDETFWKGCQSCVNYDILMSKGRQNCLCTAMLYDPKEKARKTEQSQTHTASGSKKESEDKKRRPFKGNFSLFERWTRYKRYVMLKNRRKAELQKAASSDKKKKFFFF